MIGRAFCFLPGKTIELCSCVARIGPTKTVDLHAPWFFLSAERGTEMTKTWHAAAVLAARLIFAGVFILAVSLKFADINGTANYIASAGFPASGVLVWLAVIFELLVIIAFLTGLYFREMALLAGVYAIFLAFAFHGPGSWRASPNEFGFFIDHFTFLAGLLFAAAHGPGRWLRLFPQARD